MPAKLPTLAEAELRDMTIPRCEVGASSPEYKYITPDAAEQERLPIRQAMNSKVQNSLIFTSSMARKLDESPIARMANIHFFRPILSQTGMQTV